MQPCIGIWEFKLLHYGAASWTLAPGLMIVKYPGLAGAQVKCSRKSN
jgi:hypothetical protein